MKFSNQLTRFLSFSTVALLALASGILNLHAAETQAGERLFASPDDAIRALRSAAEAKDKNALLLILGAGSKDLLTGDKVQDANNATKFAAAIGVACNPVKDGDDKITLEIGTNQWPYPIPLVKTNGQWYFDTAAGREEIISRHIGKDELTAIGVCRAYVVAQKQYADMNPKVGGGANYAQKFKSAPGKKDGLYWQSAENEPASPFGPLVAEAYAEGFGNGSNTGLHAFHGYHFRILTEQGEAAPGGKMNYVSEGVLAGGFGLVAYPEQWDHSGIMTFIVNQDGKVYQKNLGEDTDHIAAAMKEYNPDSEWTLVPDAGVVGAVTEK